MLICSEGQKIAAFIAFVVLASLFVFSVFPNYKYAEIGGIVESVEEIWTAKLNTCWGENSYHFKKITFQQKEPVLLHGEKKTNIKAGKAYKVKYHTDKHEFGRIDSIEAVE